MGAIPFVIIQLIMVGITVAFPIIVTHYQETTTVNPATIRIVVPQTDNGSIGPPPAIDFNPQPPSFGPPPKKPADPAKSN
jgi:hypothetical protein